MTIRISRTDGTVEEVLEQSVITITDPASIPPAPPPDRRLVPLAAVLLRLKLAGREQALIDLINAPGNEAARDKLMSGVEDGIYADDMEAHTLIVLAGANPDQILA